MHRLFLCLAVSAAALVTSAGGLEAGYSRVDITPPYGSFMPGYFKARHAKEALDPLEIACVAFSDGTDTALFLQFDTVGLSDAVADRMRQEIVRATGVRREAVLLHASHTHDGGFLTIDPFPDGTNIPARATATDVVYARLAVTRAADAAVNAIRDLKPARLSIARSEAKRISFGRRYLMADGKVRTNPGVGNPDIVRPAGDPPDEEVQVVRIDREGAPPIAVINFQTHPDVVGGETLTADWPGLTRHVFESATDGGALALVVNGAQGDVNHVNVCPRPGEANGLHRDFDDVDRGYAHARHMANVLAAAALSVWEKCEAVPDGKVRAAAETVVVPAHRAAPGDGKDVAWAKRVWSAHEAGRDAELPWKGMELTTEVARAKRILRLADGPDRFDLTLSGFAIGDSVAFVGFPGEPFNGIGRKVKSAGPFRMTVVSCLTNGRHGYFPLAESFREDGYEAATSPFGASVADDLVAGARRLMGTLAPRSAAVPDLKDDLSRTRLWSNKRNPEGSGGASFARHQVDLVVNEIARLDRAAERAWQGLSPDAIRARQRQVREDWIWAIGGFPERTPLNAKVTGRIARTGYAVEKVLMESRPKHYLTAHLYLPDDPRFRPPYACVVVPCGHDDDGKSGYGYQRMGIVCAKNGLAAIVYDPIDQGERDQSVVKGRRLSSTVGHNRVNLRAELIGWNTAQFRIYDGFRVFDYLETRDDIDRDRLGVSGMSGGGTLSSYLMALEPRVRAAAPAGYLSSLRDTVRFSAPQDAEQNIYGQLRFGLNHLAIVALRAPSPELVCFTGADFFEAPATELTCDLARTVYAALGAPDALATSLTRGVHAWYESEKTKAALWFRFRLNGEQGIWPPDEVAMNRLDVGFAYSENEVAFRDLDNPERFVAPGGLTSAIPGSRTVYDILRDEAHTIAAVRGEAKDEDIRHLTGIRPLPALAFTALSERDFPRADGVRAHDAVLSRDDGILIPTVTFTPPAAKGAPVLYVSDAIDLGSESAAVGALVAAGRAVTVVSPRFCGEAALCRPRWMQDRTYAAGAATRMLYWLGESIVGARAEDVIIAAKWLSDRAGAPVEVIAKGHCAVPAVHAWRLEKGLFAARPTLKSPPPSWREVMEGCAAETAAEDNVYNAYRFYDWTDL